MSSFSTWVTTGGTLLALLAGVLIALLDRQSPSPSLWNPPHHRRAREIGDSGDLDQNIDIHRNDEIGRSRHHL